MSSGRPRRFLRISKACDFCHKRRIKCLDNPLDPSRCQNCADFDILCTYVRPSKRGHGSQHATRSRGRRAEVESGAPPRARAQPTPLPNPSHEAPPDHGRVDFGEASSSATDLGWTEPLSPAWQGFARNSTPVMSRLLSVYHETVYPIFPFFDPMKLERRLELLEHARNRAFFCSVMAACALASARVRDGALPSRQVASQESGVMAPEMFFAAAEEALPRDILQCQDFDCLRGYALLALASLQDAKIGAMQMYIGHYFTMLAINQWHDESNWPTGLHPTEIEERRRLYWSMYTLDVYSAIVWDGCVHYQESHAKVEYPSGKNAELEIEVVDSTHWMVGWNFTTDLYRILEHNLSRLRSRSSKFNLLGDLATSGALSMTSQDRVTELYSALPSIFKQLQPATGDPAKDIYGFQAANIQATMALLRMVYLSLEVGVDLEKKCSVVSDVLATFHQVPKPYLRAISAPLIYHIGGIGIILGSVMEGPLSESSCRRVRDLLLSMAVLLESLEAFLHRSAGAGQRLRDLVARLEAYIDSRAAQPTHSQDGANFTGAVFQQASSSGWDEAALPDLSPQFQLPDELLQDWTWPFAMSNTYLSF
ncbi:Zinc c6 transcription factor [Pleurostoma richardsiae]|uniref:Zinc c6 transcription factor n=1 Tax=Pleurostoma richardsiae TaxID=41990 RepID=A0AA38S1T5_9PEZI|nr:Zinc c6 transcription factor [Pleurostoma richardsiae]